MSVTATPSLAPPDSSAPYGRRRRLGPWIASVVVIVASATAAVLHSPWLSLSEIEILGATHADVAGRIADLGVGDGALMIWLDTGAVETAVAADPWVRDVHAQRVFPDRLVVEVIEQRPSLWIESRGGWMLVSADGTVLEVAARPDPGLLRAEVLASAYAVGSRPDDAGWMELVDLAGVLAPDVASDSVVHLRGAELWMAVGAVDVRLGRAADLADKGRVVQELMAAGVEPGATIDVVSALRPAVVPPSVPEAGEAAVPEGEVDGEGSP